MQPRRALNTLQPSGLASKALLLLTLLAALLAVVVQMLRTAGLI